jgi:hypothetical protein
MKHMGLFEQPAMGAILFFPEVNLPVSAGICVGHSLSIELPGSEYIFREERCLMPPLS